MSVYKKLNEAREAFHQLKLTKTGLNKFAGYQYFELADFLIPAMRVLREQGLCAYVSFGKELATMKIVDMDDGTFIEITSPMSSAALKGCHEVQNLGAVQTYLRRYLWVAALEIVEHDAVDSSSGKDEKKPPVGNLKASIAALNKAKTVAELTAIWSVEVAKFPPDTEAYKELKFAAGVRKTELTEGATA